MLFPTVDFAIFFSVVFAVTWLINSHNFAKKWFLVSASCFFYGFWDASYVWILISLSIWNFALALSIDHIKHQRLRTTTLALGVGVDLGVLVFFKYFNFLTATLVNAASIIGVKVEPYFVELTVPVALSFVTFHCVAYLVDVYRQAIRPTRSIVDLLLYLSFFPHLVAGPIVRPSSFLSQTARISLPAHIDLGQSALLILGGLLKKVVLASYIASEIVDPVFRAPGNFSSLDLLVGLYGYALQIYCDFSAYTDIAIGVANLIGYQFPQNFDQPYRAVSLRDFWRRWHITLSNWLRDYLYIPLGGNQRGEFRACTNVLITMALGGLWHGASLNFLIWGLIHGVSLVIERILAKSLPSNLFPNLSGRLIGWFVTLHIVCLSWIFFRSPTLDIAYDYLVGLIAVDLHFQTPSLFAIILLATAASTQFVPRSVYAGTVAWFNEASVAVQLLTSFAAIFAISTLAPPGVPAFIYFQF